MNKIVENAIAAHRAKNGDEAEVKVENMTDDALVQQIRKNANDVDRRFRDAIFKSVKSVCDAMPPIKTAAVAVRRNASQVADQTGVETKRLSEVSDWMDELIEYIDVVKPKFAALADFFDVSI